MNYYKDSVWVFTGAKGRFPSGVFREKSAALRWITKHRLTGTLTRYPLDIGVYDWAIENQLFKAKHDGHETPEFIARFTTASQDHYHFEDGDQG